MLGPQREGPDRQRHPHTHAEAAVRVFDEGVTHLGLSNAAEHTCVRREDRSIWCWGHNNRGQVGDGTKQDAYTPVKVFEDASLGPILGGGFTCALDGAGQAFCWGSNYDGAMGTTAMDSQQPTPAFSGSFDQLAAGGQTTCGIKGDKGLWCWGSIKLGSPERHVPVPLIADGVVRVAVGSRFLCAAKVDGSLWCLGLNDSGQLGDGGTQEQWASPVQAKIDDVGPIAAGLRHACAISGDEVRCWGFDRYGQLGRGSLPAVETAPHPVPEVVPLPGGRPLTPAR